MTNNQHKWGPLLYSGLGVVAMFLVLVAVAVIANFAKVRLDLTQDRLYTLSEGTRKILGKIDTQVVVHFYRTRGSADVPVMLKNYGDRVEDLLAEYQQAAGGKLEVKKFDPQPDSDAEDSARLDGVEGQVLGAGGLIGMGEKVYLGLSVTCLDEKVALPFLDPQRERLLEYDLTRAIANVVNPQKPDVGVLSALPVFGQRMNPMMMQMGQQQGQEPWVFLSELQRDFKVRQVELTAEKIDDDLQVLVVLHPAGISEKTQFAIDQFVLRGGKLIAFLDPMSVVDSRNNQMGGMQNMLQRAAQGGSTLDKLVKAWGLEFDINKVLADKEYVTQIRRGQDGRPSPEPTWLSLTPKAISRDDPTTGDIDSLLLPGAGVFTGTPATGLTLTPLLKSSGNSMLVDKMMAQFGGSADKDFKPGDKELTLALRLTGKFKTAFPDGKPGEDPKPAEPKKEGDATPAVAATPEALKESQTDGVVILVGDTDLLYDQFSVQVQNFFGQKMVQPFNGNLSLLQNLVEQLMGDNDLIRVRSRGVQRREFEVVKNIQAEAEKRYMAKIKSLEDDAAETQRKLNDLMSNREAKNQRVILPPDIQKEIADLRAKEARTNKELKDVRKQLRKDIDALENRLKWINIAGMPVLVAMAGVSLALINRKKTAAK
jgi:ABC-type uncharacterized transport system involved in gliding motility auxiliary subunit